MGYEIFVHFLWLKTKLQSIFARSFVNSLKTHITGCAFFVVSKRCYS